MLLAFMKLKLELISHKQACAAKSTLENLMMDEMEEVDGLYNESPDSQEDVSLY